MKKILTSLAVTLIGFLSSAQAVTLVGWDIPVSTTTATSVSPMSSATGVSASSITLGSGLTVGASSSSRWNLTSYGDTTAGQSIANANTAGNYMAFTVTAAAGYNIKINGIGSLQFGSSGTGPQAWSLLYSPNSSFSSYTVIATAGNTGATYVSTSSGSTYNYTSVFNAALSSSPITILEGATGYFRIVGWNTFSTTAPNNVTTTGGGTGGIVGNLTAPDFTILGDSISTSLMSWTGGAGNWAVGTAANWQAGGVSAVWANGKDADFSVGGTLAIDAAGVSAGATAISGVTPVTLTGGALTMNSLALNADSSLNLNGAGSTVVGNLDITDASMDGGSLSVGGTISVNISSNSKTISAVLAGAGTLAKSGAGELLLTKENSYSGQTGVAAGTLTTSGTNVLPDAGTLKLDNLATFKLGGNETVGALNAAFGSTNNLQGFVLISGGNNLSFTNGAMTLGAGGLVKNGTGIMYMNQSGSTYSGGFTLNGGEVAYTSSGAYGADGVITNTVFGTGTLRMNGGTVRSSSDTSGRNIANNLELGGNVQFGSTGAAATITVNATALKTTTLLQDVVVTSVSSVIWEQSINGNYRFTKAGATVTNSAGTTNILYLRASNNIAGMTLNEGIVGYKNRNAFGNGTLVIKNGVTLGQDGSVNNSPLVGTDQVDRGIPNDIRLEGDVTFGLGGTANHFGGVIDLNGANRTVTLGNTSYFYNQVSNGGLLVDNGPGAGNRALWLYGNNNYSGGTLVRTNAILGLGSDNALGSGDLVFTNNGVGAGFASLRAATLSTNENQMRIITNNIVIGKGMTVTLETITSVVVASNTNSVNLDMTLAGIISGEGALNKTNGRAVKLTGNNTYTGGTTVSLGTLIVEKPSLTATITTNSVSLVFSNGTAVGNYPVLPGVLNGTYSAASVSGLDDYKKATFSASTGVASVVAKTSQTISFSSLPVKSPSDAPFNAGASASSSLPVGYVSSNPGVATVSSSGLITITGSGTTVITASQAGNADVAPASPVAQVLTVLASADKATISQDFQVTDPTIPLSQQSPGWSSNDPNFRPDGFTTDSLNSGNLLGMLGGFNFSPANRTTELTYRFAPGNSGLLVFEWTQNISRSTSSFPGDDTFGWKFVQGSDVAFSVRFNNDSSAGRDLLVQGYDAAGNALSAADGQINNWFIDRNDANQFRVTANVISQKWSLDVYNKATSSWYNLISNASMAGTITSLDGMVATWAVTDGTFDGTQYTGAGDNFISFDNLSIQGKQNVLISLNLPLTNPSYDGLPQSISPSTTPSGLALVVKYNGSTNAPTNAGIYTVTADLVNTTQYVVSAPASGSLIIEKAVPVITAAPTASGITYGQTLADSILSGGSASVPGSFDFTSPSDSPNAGTANQEVTFTPTDSSNYSSTTEMVSVTVAKASTSITSSPSATGITYGQTLANSSLSGGAGSVAGSFAFTTPSTAPNAGTANQGITFTPTDSNYATSTGSVSVTVAKATPSITSVPSASNINAGQNLSASLLTGGSATGVGGALLTGSFAFTSPSTTPSVGTANQGITFTPADTANYNNATGTVSVTVIRTTTPAEDYLSSFGLTGTNAALSADPDNDGLTNAAEFAFGTSPVAATGTPVVVSEAAGSLKITFLGRSSGVNYVVKTTSDLSASFSGSSAPAAVSPQPSGLPTGYTQYEASVDTTSGVRKFLKVDATLQ